MRPVTSRARASPYASIAIPTADTTSPPISRRRKPPTARGGTSAIAATGGTRAARTAGRSAASTVITTPTASDTTTVRGRTTVLVSGRSSPSSRRSWRRPTPSPEERGEHGDHHSDRQRHHHGARKDHRARVGQVQPELAQELEEAHAEPDAGEQSEQRRGHRDEERLQHHRAHHLRARRAHGAQQPELTRALAHQDGEGVEDDERPDHHADGGEPEQRVGEEAEELADRLADRDGRLFGGEDVVPGPELAFEAVLELGHGDAGVALDVYRVDRRVGVEFTLRG